MKSSLRIKAYAKLNLGLRVLAKRVDGYHELHSHLQTISLADDLNFRRADHGLTVEAPGLNVPLEENLVQRAMSLFRARVGFAGGVRCALTKRIPLGAGLGGGSSDAAATLLALNALFATKLPLETLATWAAELSSDAAFFVYGGFACIGGRGQIVHPLAPAEDRLHFVVVVPPVHCATPEVYRVWDLSGQRGGDVLCHQLGVQNDLQPAALTRYPELRPYADLIGQAPTNIKGLSGSGSAWYAGFSKRRHALAYTRSLRRGPLPMRVFLARSMRFGQVRSKC